MNKYPSYSTQNHRALANALWILVKFDVPDSRLLYREIPKRWAKILNRRYKQAQKKMILSPKDTL